MLSIGIDVSKGKSTVCGMKPGGEIVYAPFEVQHTREGMSELVSLLHNSCEHERPCRTAQAFGLCPAVSSHHSHPRNGRNALSEGLLQMGGKKGIPQSRTYGSAHLCHSSKRYPCASQRTIHADRHYGSDTSPPHSGGVP